MITMLPFLLWLEATRGNAYLDPCLVYVHLTKCALLDHNGFYHHCNVVYLLSFPGQLNFIWSLLYNCLSIPLAAGVFYPIFHTRLPPTVAALAMALSSLSVVASSLALHLYRPPKITSSDDPQCSSLSREERRQSGRSTARQESHSHQTRGSGMVTADPDLESQEPLINREYTKT